MEAHNPWKINIIKNENESWVIYKNGIEIEMHGIASNAITAAEKMVAN